MNTRYDQMVDGEWHPLKKKNQKMQCCDCFLTHREEYRIVGKNIECRVWRDSRATYAARTRRRITIKQSRQ